MEVKLGLIVRTVKVKFSRKYEVYLQEKSSYNEKVSANFRF